MAAASTPMSYSLARDNLLHLSAPIRESLSITPYTLPEGATVSVKSILESLMPSPTAPSMENLRQEIRDFILCLLSVAAADGEEHPSLYWIPASLSLLARSALDQLRQSVSLAGEWELFVEMIPEVLPVIKGTIKASCVDPAEEDLVDASARAAPVTNSIVAAHQFRWLIMQVGYPHLGGLCSLVIPCALTALDHWSPEVKEQGMRCIIHLGKNVNAAELSWFEEALLDACYRNIASSDELWHLVVEMCVLILICTQKGNPRSSWFEQILCEMIGHLERQPLNNERRIAWLQQIDPIFNALGLVILAHFRRIFPLLLQWMHADDDKTILLVLERVNTIIKLTWMRKSPYVDKLVDELTLVYKEVATRKSREVLQSHILQTLLLLRSCWGEQLQAIWRRHENDPDLCGLKSSLNY